ncbi:MAG: type II toxin-antitoxin system VapC family toxin [Gammaproteobacteria bacterium]|nr:type II toxin-antitoxin system VapC family toxin [Gammaproteobacteria bacterium]
MILVDANVLLYAYDRDSPHHKASRRWLEAQFSAGQPLRFALITLLAFVRIASDRRVYAKPLPPRKACELVEDWLAQPNTQLLQPGARTWKLLSRLCDRGQAKGVVVMDAHLAALAREHGASIATTDRDFARFPDLKLTNPVRDASPD